MLPTLDPKPNIAVLIDAENINNLASINNLIDILEMDGNIVLKRAVGDWFRAIKLVQVGMQDMGIELVHQPNFVPGNNMADVRIVIEAIEILHNPDLVVDAFAVVSSDQDFLPLYDRLRELGKQVIVAGNAEDNHARLERHSDQFIPIAEALDPEISSIYARDPRRKPKRQVVKVARKRMNPNVRGQIRDLILRSMVASAGERGIVSTKTLYQTMRRIKPNFSVKRLGYLQFAQLIRSYPDIVQVKGRRSANTSVRLLRSKSRA